MNPDSNRLEIRNLLASLTATDNPAEHSRILIKLVDIGGTQVYESLLKLFGTVQGELRHRVLDALSGVDPYRSQFLLLEVLNSDKDSDLQWTASNLLINVATLEILNPLIEVLENHPDVQVRTSIVVVLGKLGDPRALPALKFARDHDAGKTEDGYTVRGQAEIAIQSIENQAKGQNGS